MEFKVYHIGHPLKAPNIGELQNAAFAAQQVAIQYELLDIPPVNFHRVVSSLLRDPTFLGARIATPYKQTALAYCQELSPTTQGIGAVNTLVRRPSGLIYGHNTEVLSFITFLREQGVKRVRTALVLGAGGGARVALAGLRELGCARYMVGYRHPRRPAELSSQFKGIRRQIAYFPLQEMQDFLEWASASRVFERGEPMPAPGKARGGGPNAADAIKRWDLLVNATPVGYGPLADQTLINTVNFLRCFERVLDMVPVQESTQLVKIALAAGVPAWTGEQIYTLQAQQSREIWLREYTRHQEGEQEPRSGLKRVVLKRPGP